MANTVTCCDDEHPNNGSSHHMMMMYFHTDIGGDYILFQGWKPATTGDMAIACLATVLLTIFYEAFKCCRAYIQNKQSQEDLLSSYANIYHLLQSVLHGLQYLLSYCLMLIAMTYNTYLFMSIVVGGAIGYLIFNPIAARNSESSGSEDPCCG